MMPYKMILFMQAKDDLEEWQAAKQYLGHWQAVEADLPHASTA
jgi:hypothetical protein